MSCKLNPAPVYGKAFWESVMLEASEQIDYGEPIPQLTSEFLSIWSRHYSAIAAMARPHAPFLEIGTGYGILAAGLGLITGKPGYGTEHPTRKYLFADGYRRFLKNCGVHIIANDLTHGLPLADHSLLQIYLCDVIEHLFLQDADQLLSEIARVLPSGGELILSTPNINRFSNLIRFLCGRSINPPQQISSCGDTHGHVHEYAPAEISSLLERKGLKPVRIRFGLNPLYTAGVFGSDGFMSPKTAEWINRLTAMICRIYPGFGDQIYILARKK